MYANAENFLSLPLALNVRPNPGPGRRRQIGRFQLDPRLLDRFNRLVVGLGRSQPLDCDQIVSAARALEVGPDDEATPACIAQRLDQAGPVARLLNDGGWTPAHEAAPVLQAVQAYVQDANDLIPDWVPRFGRLDDAIVIDTAWPRISGELLDYLDFCRLREIEAQLRGVEPGAFGFTRREWEVSRRAEAELRLQHRRVRDSSYLPSPVSHFRVH
jgi:uncharacterized membrane protein YkvA (DUF1232 family)